MLSQNRLLQRTAAILASEFRQGFAERSGLDSVFSAERSHLSYSWYELVSLSIGAEGSKQGRSLRGAVVQVALVVRSLQESRQLSALGVDELSCLKSSEYS